VRGNLRGLLRLAKAILAKTQRERLLATTSGELFAVGKKPEAPAKPGPPQDFSPGHLHGWLVMTTN